ncbi:hypothetical protein B0H21DRAFT_439540 [Amylocystis lapponica]|nr:hypothetical protein B0H21DRAFT_439540 [Amylocystis lapponica]
MSTTVSKSIINCLMITDSAEANVDIQITRIHEHIFGRRHPSQRLRCTQRSAPRNVQVLLRRAHAVPNAVFPGVHKFGSRGGAGGGNSERVYRAFVPELGSTMHPRQVELVKRCLKAERGEREVRLPGIGEGSP